MQLCLQSVTCAQSTDCMLPDRDTHQGGDSSPAMCVQAASTCCVGLATPQISCCTPASLPAPSERTKVSCDELVNSLEKLPAQGKCLLKSVCLYRGCRDEGIMMAYARASQCSQDMQTLISLTWRQNRSAYSMCTEDHAHRSRLC